MPPVTNSAWFMGQESLWSHGAREALHPSLLFSFNLVCKISCLNSFSGTKTYYSSWMRQQSATKAAWLHQCWWTIACPYSASCWCPFETNSNLAQWIGIAVGRQKLVLKMCQAKDGYVGPERCASCDKQYSFEGEWQRNRRVHCPSNVMLFLQYLHHNSCEDQPARSSRGIQ